MGSRGPLPKLTSVRRDRAEKKRKRSKTPQAAGKTLTAPGWLAPAAAAMFGGIVADLQGAGVVLEPADAHAVGAFATAIAALQAAGDVKETSRVLRDLATWSGVVGASPAARLRMNIRPPAPKVEDDPWDLL